LTDGEALVVDAIPAVLFEVNGVETVEAIRRYVCIRD
jgi:hypothetical protein